MNCLKKIISLGYWKRYLREKTWMEPWPIALDFCRIYVKNLSVALNYWRVKFLIYSMQQIERFIVLIYSKVCGAANVLLLHHWKQIAGKHPTYLRWADAARKATTIHSNKFWPLIWCFSDMSILMQCGCMKTRTERYKCNRAGVRCTVLC